MDKLYLFWATGSCNDGSCAYGFEEFLTDQALLDRVERLKHTYGRPVYDFTARVVCGKDLTKLTDLGQPKGGLT